MSDTLWIEIFRFSGVLIAALCSIFVATLIRTWHNKRTRYRRLLKIALYDLQFMLAVEAEYAAMMVEMTGQSSRHKVRSIAAVNASWSGRFTPAGLQKELGRIEAEESKGSAVLSVFSALQRVQ